MADPIAELAAENVTAEVVTRIGPSGEREEIIRIVGAKPAKPKAARANRASKKPAPAQQQTPAGLRDEHFDDDYRDGVLNAAQAAGKFGAEDRHRYETEWHWDPVATEALLAQLSPDSASRGGEMPDHETFMAQHFPNARRRVEAHAKGERAGVRHLGGL
jgi:hypothetical protein